MDHKGGMARTYCCLFSTLRNWGKIGLMLMNNGNFAGKQIVPQYWLKKMLIPSETKPIYGYQIWIANSREMPRERISEPFLVNDMFFLDGKGKQRVYIIPSKKLVIVRVGENTDTWDESYLPNTLIRGLKTLQTPN
jgi:CubicO group peptidase (beta-lactamase class C family)